MEIFRLFGSIFINSGDADKQLDTLDKKGEKTSLSFSKLAGVAAKLGGVITAGLTVGKIVSSFGELDKSIRSFSAATGASGDELEAYKQTLTSLYNQNLGEGFGDLAKSIGEVKQVTGASGKELEGLSKNALLVRDAFDFEVNESINAANSLMKQFKISGDQAYTLIAQGAQNGANKNGDLLDSLNEYAPQFKALGFSADQFTSVLIQGAKDGAFSIDKVGDAVKEFNIRAKDMSKTSQDAFASLGMDAGQMSQAFAAGGESAQQAFNLVIQKLGEITDPVEKNRIGVELFGTQFEDLEASAILSLGNVQNIADSTAGTLDQINQVNYSSIGDAVQGIGRNLLTGIVVPLSDKVLPTFDKFSAWVTAHMPEIQKGVSDAVGIAESMFTALGKAIGFVTEHADIFLPVVIGLTAAIAAQAVIDKVVGLYKTWQTVTKTQTTLQWLLNAAMNANPLGLLALAIGAVVAAGVLLYKNWDTVKEKLGELWDWMREIGGKIGDFFSGIFDGLVSGFKWYVNNYVDVLNFLIKGLNKIHFELPDWIPGIGGKSFGIDIGLIPHLAKGTDNFPGGLAVVGEQGMELVNLPKGSQVTPAPETKRILEQERPIIVETSVILDGYQIARSSSRSQFDLTQSRLRSKGVLSPL